MLYKANLHSHTSEDAVEGFKINYCIFDLINKAKDFDFKVLALTGHEKFIYRESYGSYAKARGILLIPGIELKFRHWLFLSYHVLVLNCGREINEVKNMQMLKAYKKNNPHVFIIAPHPNFGLMQSMGIKKLVSNINLFDAIEHSWYYSKRINKNNKASQIAKKFNKPVIATSDIHNLKYLNTDYTMIESADLDKESIFKAIKNNNFYNISSDKKTFELFLYIILDRIKFFLLYPFIIKFKK